MTEWSHIVVGAGTAGCVVAARLSENPRNRVLLLEAGGRDWNPMLHIPIGTGKLLRRGLHGWRYTTDPIPGAAGRSLFWPRGKVLGGSSSLNGLVYIRGFDEEYEMWRQAGAEGWGFDDVLPAFLKAEGHTGRSGPRHATEGPHRVRRAASTNTLYDAFVEGGREAGFPVTDDFNGGAPEGFGRWDFTIHDGRRSSTATAYLHPARKRMNLEVVTEAHASSLVFEGRRAVGVTYIRGGDTTTVNGREIVLCGGVIGSPHLLMLSGVGDPAVLGEVGIAVRHALPGVGKNLQDHLGTAMRLGSRGATTLHDLIRIDRAAFAMLRALVTRDGPATEFPVEGGAFTRSRADAPLPDLQWYFNLGLDVARLRVPGLWPLRPGPMDRPGFSMLTLLMRPKSRGEIRLRSANPLENPRLLPNYLAEDSDLAVLRAGIKQARRVAAAPALARFIEAELAPGPEVTTDDEIDAWIRRNAVSAHHQAGTCRMGRDANSVVAPDLRVHGLDSLTVADASVMPVVTSGGTYAPTVMIGERAAAFFSAGEAGRLSLFL